MPTSPVRVLVVDDEPICRQNLQFALEQYGFECDTAEDGSQAHQSLSQRDYDAIVTELIMPNLNGGEFVIKLCSQRPRPIVVVQTALNEPEVSTGLTSEGVDAIVYKPVCCAKTAEVVRYLIERRCSATYLQHAIFSPIVDLLKVRQPMRLLGVGNDWIQERAHRAELFRFGIIILACILFGLGWGQSLSPQIASQCQTYGLSGLAFYFSLELVAYYKEQNRAELRRYLAEGRRSREILR